MILIASLRYIILDKCIDVFFRNVYGNFFNPEIMDSKFIEMNKKIYEIYKKVKGQEGIDIGTFEDFCRDQHSIFSYGTNSEELLEIQLTYLQEKYPEFSSF